MLVMGAATVHAQEPPVVKPADLKASPQRYWAGFFVFSDVLTGLPSDRSIKIDNDNAFKFETLEVGDVYAEAAAAETLRRAAPGSEYLFFATVKQQKSGVWGRLRGGDFVVIVKEAARVERDAETIAGMLTEARMADATNETARALFSLNEVSRAAQQELFGFAQSEGMTLEELLASPEQQDKVNGSIRSALRKFEQQNRSSSQELFVGVIRSLMATTDRTDGARESLPDYKTDDPGLTGELDAGMAIDAGLTEALAMRQAELEREMAAREAAEARAGELQARIDQLSNQLKALMAEAPEDGSPQPGLSVALEIANVELEREVEARTEAEMRVKNLQAEVDRLAIELEALHTQASASEQDVESRIADAWASARAELEKQTAARATAESQVESLRAQLDELGVGAPGELTLEFNEELEITRAELAEQMEKSRMAQVQITELAAEVHRLQNALAEREAKKLTVPALRMDTPRLLKTID